MNVDNEKLGIAALVCGLASIFVFPLAFGSAGIILGLVVMERTDKDSRAYGNARIGLIAGIAGLALWVATLAALGFLGFDAGSLPGSSSNPAPAF